MSRVLLVNMPFSNLRWPNLGPSLLQAALQRRGIPCQMAYLNFDFAEQIGYDDYYWIADHFAFVLGGERLFAKHYFPGQLPEDEQYYRQILLRADPEMTEQEFRQYQALEQHVEPFLDHCERAIDWSQYRIVGFATTFQQTMASLCLARRIKRRHPEVVIVFGGAACEGEMGLELLAQFPEIDYVFLGEADLNFPLFVEQLLQGGPIQLPQGVVGRETLAYLSEGSSPAEPMAVCFGSVQGSAGAVVPQPRRAKQVEVALPASVGLPARQLGPQLDPLTVYDLDSLPYPNFDDYFQRYAASPLKECFEPLLFFETSRGCWWGQKHHCKFCGLNGASLVYRSKSPRRAVEELVYLARRYGVYGVRKACTSDNILDYRYFDSFLPMFREAGVDLKYVFEMKCNLTRQQVEQLLACGLGAAQLGIETFITPILRMIHKGATGLQNLQTLKWFSEPGIEVKWNILYGFPGENPEDYRWLAQLIPSLYHLAPPIAWGRVRLDRFSPYFEDPVGHGMTNPRPNPAFQYVYPFPESVLRRLAYYYEYDYADGRNPHQYFEPVRQEIERWYSLAGTVTLRQWDRPDGVLVLTDTRPHAAAFQRRLIGWQREVYLFCDTGRTFRSIMEHLGQWHQSRADARTLGRPAEGETAHCPKNLKVATGPGSECSSEPLPEPETLRRLLNQWVAERIMAYLDDRYLSLALRAPKET
ncbi:MAG: RiPP maturation radical SAM C-methyltransferase [Thermoguttaceae bacterium]|nr:RiPP maturation radical SAM C-methyltransferase [Thermoguttaceae bacterium]MDW8036482.1 RiPP maturation radical SAM C-methyltransferase [Thermoguttaceae bacterium]